MHTDSEHADSMAPAGTGPARAATRRPGPSGAAGPSGGSGGAVDGSDAAAVALARVDTPIGPILVASTAAGVSGVFFGDDERGRARLTGGLAVADNPALTAPAVEQVTDYFTGARRGFDLPLDWRRVTSPLARDTLGLLHATVPYGATITYGELAARVSERRGGNPVPARAIGAVMGSNPLPLVVPCHRVVAGDGLGGFSGGSGREVKRYLLMLEGAIPPTLDFAMAGA